MANIINACIIAFLYSTLFFIDARQINGYLQNHQPQCNDSTHVPIQYTGTCNVYLECKNGQLHMNICKHGLNFNPQLGICDSLSEIKNCKVVQNSLKNLSNNCPKNDIKVLPDSTDCTKWIVCFLGIPYYKSCKLGFVYNNDTGKCDNIENVPRCSNKINEVKEIKVNDDNRYVVVNEFYKIMSKRTTESPYIETTPRSTRSLVSLWTSHGTPFS